MPQRIYVNGRLLPPEQATLSVEDAGLQHGVGLFETLHARHGRCFRLREHLQRLSASARSLGLARDIDTDALASAIRQTLQANERTEARVRLTLTAGEVSLLRPGPAEPPGPSVIVTVTDPTRYDPAYFERGIAVLIAPPGANPFDSSAGHKTLNYWPRLRTLRQAAAVGAGEAIWLNITNHLASGSISNLFLVQNDRLLTPFARGEETPGSLPAPVLPGVTRQAIIQLAERHDIELQRRMLSIDDLLSADEVFLTNSAWHVLPVTRVEKQSIAEGRPGPITSMLRAALLELIDHETQTE